MVTSLSLLAVWKIVRRAGCGFAVVLPMLAIMPAAPSFGDIVYNGSSVVASGSNAAGLSARATFTVDPMDSNVLRLFLENTSTAPTLSPSELLTSIYFNVLSGTTVGTSPTLTYQSASGQVYLALPTAPDKPATYVPPPPTGGTTTFPTTPAPSNLMAINTGDNTWQFRDGMSLVASQPPLAFGVGTVGNTSLSPDNFNGSIVGNRDFGIYVGDVTTQNLKNELLVKNSATFTFAGFGGFDLSQVSPHVVFGFGTNPEVIISVPEPGTLSLATFGLLAALLTRRRLRGRSTSVRHAKALEICCT